MVERNHRANACLNMVMVTKRHKKEDQARRAIQALADHASVVAAFLFGSQVEGAPDEYSDIDIGAFVEEVENWDAARAASESAYVQESVGDDVELHFFPAQQLRDCDAASFAASIIRHGQRVFP